MTRLWKKPGMRPSCKRAAAMVLGLCSMGMFFLPQMTFVFRDIRYVASGWELVFAKGFWFGDAQEGSLIAVPLLLRLAVLGGMLCAVAGTVGLWCCRPSFSGIAYLLSGISPLVSLVAAASLQSTAAQLHIHEMSVEYRLPFMCVLAAGVVCAVLALWTQGVEALAQAVFLTASCVSIGAVLLLTVYLFAAGVPAIAQIGFFRFLFGTQWDAGQGKFGIFPLLLATLSATAGAVLVGVPVGVLTAVFLREMAGERVAKWMRPAVELLAGIPSVVYGFFGMLVVVPAIRGMFGQASIGDSLLAAIVILSIMVIPTIVNVTEQSLGAVPKAWRQASLGLGATPVQTVFRVTIPAARRGILSGVILGVGRAVGETMAVIMVAGNVAEFPRLLGSVRFLTTGIAMEMSYASGLHRQALFSIGLILFLFLMAVNLSFTMLAKRGAGHGR